MGESPALLSSWEVKSLDGCNNVEDDIISASLHIMVAWQFSPRDLQNSSWQPRAEQGSAEGRG